MSDGTRVCPSCKNDKPIESFPRNDLDATGARVHSRVCRSCQTKAPTRTRIKTESGPATTHQMMQVHSENRRIRNLVAEKKSLLKELAQARDRVRLLDAIQDFSPWPVVEREKTSRQREACAIVLCSDWHVEEPVESEKVNGLNEYNLAVADARIQKLCESVIRLLELHRNEFHIRDMVLALMGDHFSGYIHEELEEGNELSPIEAILWLQERIPWMIDTILAGTDIEQLLIPCVVGNHGRTTKKKRHATRWENSYEWMMFRNLAQRYEGNDRVQWIIPKSELIYIDVYEWTLRFTHGDSIRGGSNIGGITIPINKMVHKWNDTRHAHITNMGHFHQLMMLEHLVINGSLIGYSPFSVSYGFSYEPPRQAFYLMDSKRGKCMSTPIWVD